MAALRGGSLADSVLPLEVERKFLVPTPPDWLSSCTVEEIEQGYLAIEGDEIEVRLRRSGTDSYLTVKRGSGPQRVEVEIEVGAEQFEALWALTAGRRLSKARHHVRTDGGDIEVDVYRGTLEGLITAEIEFPPGDQPQSFEPPEWLGDELTGDPAYANKSLATSGVPPDAPPQRLAHPDS